MTMANHTPIGTVRYSTSTDQETVQNIVVIFVVSSFPTNKDTCVVALASPLEQQKESRNSP